MEIINDLICFIFGHSPDKERLFNTTTNCKRCRVYLKIEPKPRPIKYVQIYWTEYDQLRRMSKT